MRTRFAATTLAIVAAVSAAPALARADGDPATRSSFQTYARGETGESVALLGAGVASLAAGAFSVSEDTPIRRGLGIPFLAGGIVELVSGAVLYARTARLAEKADGELRGDAETFRARELTRVAATSRSLGVAQVLEASVFAGGGMLAYFSSGPKNDLTRGLGLGFAIEGAMMLTVDTFASLRAGRYTESLRAASGISVRPERSGAVVTFQRAF